MWAATMTTSDKGAPAAAPADAELALAMAKEIERLANGFFASGPPNDLGRLAGPVMNEAAPEAASTVVSSPGAVAPPRMGPHALNVGAGGVTPSMTAPPIPGQLHRPTLAAAPPPTEKDLRAIVECLEISQGRRQGARLSPGLELA